MVNQGFKSIIKYFNIKQLKKLLLLSDQRLETIDQQEQVVQAATQVQGDKDEQALSELRKKIGKL